MRSPRSARALRWSYGIAALGVAGHAAHALGLGRPALDALFELWVYTALMVFAASACLLRAATVRRERGAWTAIGLALALWAVGDMLWDFHFGEMDEPPWPNVADGFYLSSYVAQYTGLLLLLRARLRPWRLAMWLDGLIGGLAVAALGATAIFPTILAATEGDAAAVAFTLAYPLLDCLALCFVVLAFALCGWRPGRQWVLLGMGFVLAAVGDAAYNYMTALGTFRPGTLVSSMWPAGALLMSLAAWQRSAPRPVRHGGAAGAGVTAAAGVVALGVLVAELLGRHSTVGGALALGAVGLVIVRCLLTLRENDRIIAASHHEAVTDALSGLPNRRRLLSDLADACEEGAPATLAFFDLDGFKLYNDTFGHGAGDSLLARLGGALALAVAGRGVAYRLGGDEFCVLFDDALTPDAPAVLAARQALSERGERFAVTASLGLVVVPDDAAAPEQAMRLADERMYADKRSGRASGLELVTDVLLATLREHEPSLGEHHGRVAALANAVARRLGCDNEVLDEVTRAAALHDVGKVAIPDALLTKAGPLTDGEWAFVRRHTVIGERIVASVPALRPVAGIIRSSHEHVDGSGYPDGLRGEDIPLASRIVAVCDAWDAMLEERPYQPARPPHAALEELRRCAGTQFDPRVVEAAADALADAAGGVVGRADRGVGERPAAG